jgi:DNA repair exonuclease SbcCD ATPase subunit
MLFSSFIIILIVSITSILILFCFSVRKKERERRIRHMKEFEISEDIQKERDSIKYHEKEMEKGRNRLENIRLTEERRLSEELKAKEEKLQERLRKESENRRKKQKIAGHGNDIGTQTISIIEQSTKMLISDTKDIIKMAKELLQKRAEEKQLTEQECNKIVQAYETLKNQVEKLDKVNKNLENLKDKKVIEKYEVSKKELESKISNTLDIQKEKPKFLQSKAKTQEQEKTFSEKIQKGLADLREKANIARVRLQQLKSEKKVVVTKTTYKDARGNEVRTNTKAKTQAPKTRTR